MDRRYPSWLRETLRIWSQYLAIVLAAIPAAILAALLIARGFSEQTAMIVCVPVALSMAFVGWQLVALWSRKQRRLVVSASPHTYQLSWGRPAVTSAGFIEKLSRAALTIPSLEAAQAAAQTAYTYRAKTTVSSMFAVAEEQKNVLPIKDRKQTQRTTGNQPSASEDQLMRAAALPYFENATV